MAKFDYEVLSSSGTREKGAIEASDERDGIRQLRSRGNQVISLKPSQPKTSLIKQKIDAKSILQWLDELVTLLRAGVTLGDAIESLAESQLNEQFQAELEQVARGLQQGESFSVTLEKSKIELPDYLVQLAKAGELSGNLAETLQQGLEQMQFDDSLATETKNALVYPSILVASGILAVLLVFTLVVPKFTNLLKDDVELPGLAECVLKAGVFFNDNALYIFVGITLLVLVLTKQFQNKGFRDACLQKLSSWPLIGSWLSESETGRWTSILGALLNSGVPLMDSLDLANSGVRIRSRKRKLDIAAQAVKSGQSLSSALKEQEALLPTAYNILKVGEKAGELPAMLKSLSELYEKNSRNRMKRLLVLIEPLAILIIGSVIGCIMLGVVLAITASSEMPL